MLIFQLNSLESTENLNENAQTNTVEEESVTDIEIDTEIENTVEQNDSKSRFEPLEGSFIDHPKIKDFGEYFCVFLMTKLLMKRCQNHLEFLFKNEIGSVMFL